MTLLVSSYVRDRMPTWDVSFHMRLDTGSPRVVQAVARAHALAGVIRGIPVTPLVRSHFDSLNILRAVRGTTGIEGGDLSEPRPADVIAAAGDDAPVLPPRRARMEQEARNAHRAMVAIQHELTQHPDRALDEALIREIHRPETRTTSTTPTTSQGNTAHTPSASVITCRRERVPRSRHLTQSSQVVSR